MRFSTAARADAATRPVTRSGGVRAECDSVCARLLNATPPTVRTALTISRPQNCGAVFGRACNRINRKPNSLLRVGACWSVYELTHRAPGSRWSAGSRRTRTECLRICWQTIFICGKPQWYGKPLKQLGLLSRQADIRRVTGASSVNLRVAVFQGRIDSALLGSARSYPEGDVHDGRPVQLGRRVLSLP
jgi:hypothetical protein